MTKGEASTTMVFARLLSKLLRDPSIGRRIVPIVPDEARTFGMDALFSQVGIYSSLGQRRYLSALSHADAPKFYLLMDVAAGVWIGGFWLAVFFWVLKKHPLLPTREVYLLEAYHHGH